MLHVILYTALYNTLYQYNCLGLCPSRSPSLLSLITTCLGPMMSPPLAFAPPFPY